MKGAAAGVVGKLLGGAAGEKAAQLIEGGPEAAKAEAEKAAKAEADKRKKEAEDRARAEAEKQRKKLEEQAKNKLKGLFGR